MRLKAFTQTFACDGVFVISRGARTHAEVVTVEIGDRDILGRGECTPYQRYGETLDSVLAQIESIREAIEREIDQQDLQNLLPAGAARNAVDCALLDFAAKKANKPIHQLLGLESPKTLTTAFTLSLGSPESMHESALKNANRPLLKMKLGGDGDIERVEAVRSGAPNARLIVDANEAWSVAQYEKMVPALNNLQVEMIEQPFPAGEDAILAELERPVKICADESCHDRQSLPALKNLYDMVNIKLDKTGGLTEALALNREAKAAGFKTMVGCMVATSLAMAPAIYVAQNADIIDLDGPLLLAEDRDNSLRYELSTIFPPDPALWG
ncbi:MAG: dipeptide epimerase [Rhizobiaceae bacterium]